MEYFSFSRQERAGILAIVVLLVLFAIAPRFACQPKPVAVNIKPDVLQQLMPVPGRRPDSSGRYFQDLQHQMNEPWRNGFRGAYRSYHRNERGYLQEERREYRGYPLKYPPTRRSYPAGQARYRGSESKDEKRKNDFHAPRAGFYEGSHLLKVIDINEADTTALIALPGIGSKLASRIVLFREKLGGFYSVDQVREVYGLKDDVFMKIQPWLACASAGLKKIDINSAEKNDLGQHPYIRWQVANAVVEYRLRHGRFYSLSDLTRINSLDSSRLSKMMPYLTVH